MSHDSGIVGLNSLFATTSAICSRLGSWSTSPLYGWESSNVKGVTVIKLFSSETRIKNNLQALQYDMLIDKGQVRRSKCRLVWMYRSYHYFWSQARVQEPHIAEVINICFINRSFPTIVPNLSGFGVIHTSADSSYAQANPKSPMQHDKSALTRMFFVFRSLWATAGFPSELETYLRNIFLLLCSFITLYSSFLLLKFDTCIVIFCELERCCINGF